MREELKRRLRPRPLAARRLEGLAKEHGALLPRHYWELGLVANWLGGTMGLHRQEYEPYFTAAGKAPGAARSPTDSAEEPLAVSA